MSERAKYDVVVSERARDMLFDHARFLAQVSVSTAEKLFDRFEERVESLEDMPERCSFYINPYIKTGKYRKLDFGNHLWIIFQIKGRKVLIDLVIDARAKNMDLI